MGAIDHIVPIQYGKLKFRNLLNCDREMRLEPAQKQAVRVKKAQVRRSLLRWSRSALRDYPWRKRLSEPYPILVAEILLKRTTAKAASKIYCAFLERYPNLKDLFGASEFDLSEIFAPIGLHRQRASTVTKLARWISHNEGGVIPSSLGSLMKVPGLGSYSARAIRSFAFNVPEGIVDGNVVRVYSRVFRRVCDVPTSLNLVQSIADELVPKGQHQAFNFALIDLGGTVCRPVAPKCGACPLNQVCDTNIDSDKDDIDSPERSLRTIRLHEGLSISALSQQSGISRQTIINTEAGRSLPGSRTLSALSQVLQVRPEELIGLTNEAAS